jgi:hypothetical protein
LTEAVVPLLGRLSVHLTNLLVTTWEESDETREQLREAIVKFNELADLLAPDQELYIVVPDE